MPCHLKTTSSVLKKLVASSTSQSLLSSTGTTLEKLNVSEQKVVTGDTSVKMSSQNSQTHQKRQKEKSVTVESLPSHKGKTWKHKLSSLEVDTQTTKLLEILGQESTSKEKVLTPFWTPQSKVISEKLWLPTKIDFVDSVLTSSKELSESTPMGQSWFSIKKKHPQRKNSLMTSFQSSQFSLPDSMDSEVTLSNDKSGKEQLKTLKIRLFPTEKEQEHLQLLLDQYKWYYNCTLTVVYNHYGWKNIEKIRKYSAFTVRDLIKKYNYVEEVKDNLIFKDFVYDETSNSNPVPEWWKGKVHSRLPRGAFNKFVSSLNSAISNSKNGNIKKFNMSFMSKKSNTRYLNFEDKGFPAFIKKIKSRYWYTTRDRKRKYISFPDVDKCKRGLEIVYEKETDRYFLHYPIERSWFPDDDRRNDRQVKFTSKGDRIISLDPGVRKFLVGYDPRGYSLFIGEGANIELMNLLYDIDKIEKPYKEWKRVKNLVNELHWKTISFLVENYDIIILPDFRVQQMVRKKKLGRMTKRLMNMFSFYKFKEKLRYKCEIYKKRLIIVDESYTSCTCGVCGTINKTGGKELFKCKKCDLEIDRDVTGARNILIKNTTLR